MTQPEPGVKLACKPGLSTADLALFAAASLDFNPLHLDEAYARSTAYGQPVAFGVLAGLLSLARVDVPPGHTLIGLTLEFLSPVMPGLPAQWVCHSTSPLRQQVEWRDGSRVLLRLTARLGPGSSPVLEDQALQGPAQAPRTVADDWSRADLKPGDKRCGNYQANPEAFGRLIQACGLAKWPVVASRIAALLWGSYLVGMELPGRRALFNALNIEFEPEASSSAPLEFEASIKAFDPRFGLLRVPFNLSAGGRPHARGEIRAFVREAPALALDDPGAWLAPAASMAGKVAWVVGGSRGLGARIARALAGQGATVIVSYWRSSGLADELVSLGHGPGRIIAMRADAASPAACLDVVKQALAVQGRLDVLICNACPPILPMWVDDVTASRVGRYIADSVDLVVHPLAAALPALAVHQGQAVVMSSVYAVKPPPNFPHYVAAKRAIEGLVEAMAAKEQAVGFVLVRPPRLEGELNMPMKGELVLSAGQVAGVLARQLALAPALPGQVQVLQAFQPSEPGA